MSDSVQPLPPEALRWHCDPALLESETTDAVEPIAGVIGQSAAVEALRFGLECDAEGQNVFVRGLTGTGRMTMIGQLLRDLQPECESKLDRCYVHNFSDPDRPRLISLEAGRARVFRRRVNELVDFIGEGLPKALESAAVKARRTSLEARQRSEMQSVVEPFELELREANLALVSMPVGPTTQMAIFPVVDGKPVPPEQFDQLRADGKLEEEQYQAFLEQREALIPRLREVTEKVGGIQREGLRAVRTLVEETLRGVLEEVARAIKSEFPGEDVRLFLEEVVEDVLEDLNRPKGEENGDPRQRYGVNVLLEQASDSCCPIVIENTPTLPNLLGTVERAWGPRGPMPSDYRMVRGGSLLRADGGYLILDARDVLSEAAAWKMLVRTLRSGRLEMVPAELTGMFWSQTVKPEPIPIQVRVILVGDHEIYYLLDHHDPDFSNLFKVLADFDSVIRRDPEGVRQYQGVLARIARDEHLLPFHRTAVAALAEHGARIAASAGKLTARFARVADIAREAAFLARKRGAEHVTNDDVDQAVERTKRRADLPSRRFQELLERGTIQLHTSGSVVGQINGLAVMSAGPLTYGFPARITASIGAGSAGIINIEGRSDLSGAIHTKGFNILAGLLRNLLQTDHPLAFSASIAFEQSYGGIDGDSASGAEICCLLSALTGIPIRQDLAMTGAIDQLGHLQAIGGVNEKIEGFFDTCRGAGLTGEQGVIIPMSNAGELMLRKDVVQACADGRFGVYPVDTLQEALHLLTGVAPGERDQDGVYPEGSLLALAVDRALEFWAKTLRTPTFAAPEEEELEEDLDAEVAAEANPEG